MKETILTTGQITFDLDPSIPVVLYNNKRYIDFSSVIEISELPSTTLFRLLKKDNLLENNILHYKNRIYYDITYVFTLFRFKIK